MADVLRTVIVSDLHIGSNPTLDDFTGDDEFAAFLALPELNPSASDRVDLVLLGDSFDLWQSVPEDECRQDNARRIDLAFSDVSETGRLDLIKAKHARWFDALSAFGHQRNCKLVFVTGNHDHSLVEPGVQGHLAQHLDLAGSRQLQFANFYENAQLRLYADHGNQYDHNNQYGDFGQFDWKADCSGYYFVKLFFNRLEFRDPRIDNSPGGWAEVWHWLRRIAHFRLLAAAIRYFWQYWNDPRVPSRISPVATRAAGAGVPGPQVIEHPTAPVLLVAGRAARSKESFFSTDPTMEQFFRQAYDVSPDVRVAVNEILEAQQASEAPGGRPRGAGRALGPRGKPARRAAKRAPSTRRRPEVPRPVAVRGAPEAPRGLVGPPEDVAWAEGLFTVKPYFRDRLTRDAVDFVVFGHTHGALEQQLSNRATYLNTGTWATQESSLPVVVAECTDGGAPTARLRWFRGGALS
jgi:UDP-2,3-diacylglucosamine pyrophosphatase LpxH